MPSFSTKELLVGGDAGKVWVTYISLKLKIAAVVEIILNYPQNY